MEPTNTELSGRTAAMFSWLEFLGIILILTSLSVFKSYREILQVIALIFLLSGFIYKIIRDWKAGRKSSARLRLIILVIIIVSVTVVALR